MASRLRITKHLASLDPERDHLEIIHYLVGYEFPWDYIHALEMALYRTGRRRAPRNLLERPSPQSRGGVAKTQSKATANRAKDKRSTAQTKQSANKTKQSQSSGGSQEPYRFSASLRAVLSASAVKLMT